QRLLDNTVAIALLEEAFELIEEPTRRARIALELGRCLLRANRHQAAIAAFRRGREVLGEADRDLDESIWSELVNAAWWSPDNVPVAVAELAKVDAATLHGGVGTDLLRASL